MHNQRLSLTRLPGVTMERKCQTKYSTSNICKKQIHDVGTKVYLHTYEYNNEQKGMGQIHKNILLSSYIFLQLKINITQ